MTDCYRFKNPSQISIELTNICNFHCLHCINNASINCEEYIDRKKIYEIIDYMKANGIVCLDFSGGEPLLYPNFLDIIDYAADNEMTLSIATNGSLLTDNILSSLKNANVSLRISLDGFNEKINSIFRPKNTFCLVDDKINLCINHGLIPTISCVLHKRNYDHFEALVEYVKSKKLKKIRVIPFIANGRGDKYKKEMLTKAQWKNFILGHKIIESKYGIEIAIDSPLQSIITNDYMPCVVGKFLAVIKPNGDVIPCSILNVVIGNIYKQSIKEIWNNKLIDELNDTNLLKGKCKKCNLREKCSGGCRGLAFSLKGDYLCPDPYCWKLNQNK